MSDFWQIFRFVIAALLTLAGVFCMISSVLGLYRFRYALTRIHAASLMDTVSIFLMLSGLSVATGFTVATAKMVVVILFLWITSPAASPPPERCLWSCPCPFGCRWRGFSSASRTEAGL